MNANGHIERLVTALEALSIAERLLTERGYKPDSSTRHNLAIARSNIMDVCELLSAEVTR